MCSEAPYEFITQGEDMEENENKEITKKDIAKAYGEYVRQFTPKPAYFTNCLKAFISGGIICCVALFFTNLLEGRGTDSEEAAAIVTVAIIMIAQLLTGIGVFDRIAKYLGAGVIVPISGFANSMVAPAIEYKKEGPVLGAGSKMFSVAGPVLVLGITAATAAGMIYLLIL